MSKRKIAGTPTDPTLPKTPVNIDGKEYTLCFDLGALAEAEAAILAEGHQVNLLAALPVLNLSNVRLIFAAAIRKFHPDVTFSQAVAMVTLRNVYALAQVIADAWKAAIPEVEVSEGEAQPGQ